MSAPYSTVDGVGNTGVVYLYIRNKNGTYSEKFIYLGDVQKGKKYFGSGCRLDDTNIYVNNAKDVYFYPHGITEGEKITKLVQFKIYLVFQKKAVLISLRIFLKRPDRPYLVLDRAVIFFLSKNFQKNFGRTKIYRKLLGGYERFGGGNNEKNGTYFFLFL